MIYVQFPLGFRSDSDQPAAILCRQKNCISRSRKPPLRSHAQLMQARFNTDSSFSRAPDSAFESGVGTGSHVKTDQRRRGIERITRSGLEF